MSLDTQTNYQAVHVSFEDACSLAGAIVNCDEDGTKCWKDMLA